MDYLKVVIAPIVFVGLIGIACTYPIHLMLPYGLVRFLIVCTVGAAAVIISSYLIALNKYERQIIRGFINALLSRIGLSK